ncbi:serine hydrolase domain-containing protein [Pseudobacteroides cellulosolvens]|uniref:Beta-lactamase n=1 Tax=Pseudobacteroides cellulosolvens ATCC 35603 = DSM 2933 TaxID=398512 RepID=A0A0L6JPU8_9FIRM|nr:serine hydrolase domain-containing protein [Pseudobacteroides cellulosolvens]KNY27814.1 beta-lactamase [Pseudobacteroides cellulosolvens ATCC 35603 = DSM 2933]
MARFDDLSALLKQFVKNGPAGCGCAVAKDGKTLYQGYFGYADLEEKKPITEDTLYRLFSMTKVVICTAALMLFERGKFLLNEPIYEYFPEYRNTQVFVTEPNGKVHTIKSESPMLIKHAFTMSIGLGFPFGDSPTAKGMAKVKDELQKKYGKYDIVTEIKAMGSVPVEFHPGTRWQYGYGHDIIAGLIQMISGKTVGQFLQDEIFGPLGMENTGYRYREGMESRIASNYRKDENGRMIKVSGFLDEFHQPDAVYEPGGAGLFSTVNDYLKFSQMLANDGSYNGKRIIGRKTIDLMRTNHLNEEQLKDFSGSYLAGYGYGLGVRTLMSTAQGHSNGSVGEFGWTGMLGTYVSIDPQEGFSVVYMHQMEPNMEEYHHLRVRAVANGGLV